MRFTLLSSPAIPSCVRQTNNLFWGPMDMLATRICPSPVGTRPAPNPEKYSPARCAAFAFAIGDENTSETKDPALRPLCAVIRRQSPARQPPPLLLQTSVRPGKSSPRTQEMAQKERRSGLLQGSGGTDQEP